MSSSPAQLWVDFNSSQATGGTPVAGDPADPTNAAHQEAGYLCYHATHEVAADFIAASYDVTFSQTGDTTVTMTPAWPNTTDNRVQQSIGRSQGQADTWLGENVNLLRDWIGADARTGNGGNDSWDEATGTPTYMTLTFGDLPAGNYEMTSFHHDVENMNSEFNIEVSTDGGATFSAPPVQGRMTNSLAAGNPSENEVLAGTPPNEAGGDPKDLSSTQIITFSSTGSEVVIRYAPVQPALRTNVHIMFFGMNGFQLEQLLASGDSDGDDLPDAWEDRYFGNNDGEIDPEDLTPQDGGGDPDMDNVDNETEFFDNTNPNEADTDMDDLDDDQEKVAMTDPLDPDSDNDTLTDGAEVNVIGTDPLDVDSDDDFFLDPTEVDLMSGSDPGLFPVSDLGMLVDFSSTSTGGQAGVFHDQGRLPFVADHEVDGSVDSSKTYPVAAFGVGTEVTLTVDFPDTTANTVKQMIGRGSSAAYTGSDGDLARDWAGVDARAAQGGNGFDLPTSIRFTFEDLPAGAYLLSSFHHDVQNQNGSFDVFLMDANNASPAPVGSRKGTASGPGENPADGATLSSLSSTFQAVITSNGSDPIEITYSATEADNGAGGTLVTESFLVINGFDLVTTTDGDMDGIPDDYEDANGLDKTVNDAALDLDNDELSNFEEYNLGTPPNDDDADDDGALDGAEIDAGSNPFVQDTDGDGLLDGPELAIGADPNNTDSDGDGFLDGTDPDPVNSAVPSTAENLCAYWPLDTTDGATTPDRGPNGYDMMLNNMTAANFVVDEGRQAASFDNASSTMLTYTATEGDDIPITLNEIYTVAMWVKIKGTDQSDLRFFSEGSTSTTTPLFNMGTRNNGADDSFDLYVRPAGGPAHEFSNGMPLDGVWRHLAITGNSNSNQFAFYVDGVLDRADFTFRSLTGSDLNTTSIGGILRATPGFWVTGLVDDVGLWKKILSPDEIAELASGVAPDQLGGAGLAFTKVEFDSGANKVTLTWNSTPGKTYAVRYSDDLDDDPDGSDPRQWSDLDDGVPAAADAETTSFEDGSPPAGRRFYIVEEL